MHSLFTLTATVFRYFRLWRCEGLSPVLEYSKIGASKPLGHKLAKHSYKICFSNTNNASNVHIGFIILAHGTAVRADENLTSKSKNGIHLKVTVLLCILS